MINNTEKIRQMISELQLDAADPSIAKEIGKTVVPTYALNSDWKFDTFTASSVTMESNGFTVPDNEVWEILWIHTLVTTSATVGTRVWRLRVLTNAGGMTAATVFGDVTQTASIVREYNYTPQCTTTDSNANGVYGVTIFPRWMGPGWVLEIDDRGGNDEAGDLYDLFVTFRRHKL